MLDERDLIVAGREGEPNLVADLAALLRLCEPVGTTVAAVVGFGQWSTRIDEEAVRDVFADAGVELVAWLPIATREENHRGEEA
jgi:hypothetical protein